MSKPLPEITIKALFLGILLSIVLASANAYLGLFAGMTVSASIPAADISMGVLSLFRKKTIVPHVRLTGIIGSAGRFKQGMELANQRDTLKKAL